ncbi:hypothetical protein H2200_000503 [Cladophialophora chaetospira]|uniref:HypA-like protein n=1 Tax=Cladophialophora chaetospira TaxID=386627 RepID=A0AA38XPK5_9EURO|nr:hypothetical protein H2200_000503 [Cladophialophora chaetospira]
MATATTIHLSPSAAALIRILNITSAAADRVTSLLQTNHSDHHILFDQLGRHNHIVHHLLASFSLGADAKTLQKQYDQNVSYQRPPPLADKGVVSSLTDPEVFESLLGKPENYTVFLTFFAQELSTSSIPEVVNKIVFADTPIANKLFNLFFAGYYHPFIHLGYGLEYDQPALVAEGLAQACIHSSYLDEFFTATAEASQSTKPDTLVNLLHAVHGDEKLRNAVKWEDGQKVRDGILARAKDEMIAYAARWQVPLPPPPAVYFTACAQNPPKVVKFDFFYMHAVTSSLFLSVFLQQDWISDASKAKLIEWKGRLDLVLYASRRSPKLLIDEIRTDVVHLREWDDMFLQACAFMDDGHTVKFVRALANDEKVCAPFEGGTVTDSRVNGAETNGVNQDERWQIKGDMWRRLAGMVLDSVQPKYRDRWLRSVGFEEAWKDCGLREDFKG